MTDEKDRMGETLRRKEKADEDRYFAQQDRRALERLRAREAAAARRDRKPTCPRCGEELTEEDRLDIFVDSCPKGCGVWLDEGELDVLAERVQNSWLSRFVQALPRPR